MYSYIYTNEINLDEAAISRANNVGTLRAKEAEEMLKQFAGQFPIRDELTVHQVEYLAYRQAKWAELVTEAYNDKIRRLASFTPDTINWHKKMERFLDKTRKTLEKLMPVEKEKTA